MMRMADDFFWITFLIIFYCYLSVIKAISIINISFFLHPLGVIYISIQTNSMRHRFFGSLICHHLYGMVTIKNLINEQCPVRKFFLMAPSLMTPGGATGAQMAPLGATYRPGREVTNRHLYWKQQLVALIHFTHIALQLDFKMHHFIQIRHF